MGYPDIGYTISEPQTQWVIPVSLNDTKRILLREMLISQRKEKNLTQAELAERLNRPQSFVSKYESGERKLDAIELIEVLQSLECSPPMFIENYCRRIK